MKVTQNRIKVLFFSKIVNLSEALESIFSEEVDFSFQKLSELDDLWVSKPENSDSILILDLSQSTELFCSIIDKNGNDFRSKPVIFLLDNDQKINFINDRNCDLYEIMWKPFRIDELISKIRSFATSLTRSRLDEFLIIMQDNYFYPNKNLIKNFKGNSIRLTEKETEIIKFLCKGKGKILSKDVLLKMIWGYEKSITTHTLETHIYRLRKKIKVGLGETELILKNNKGYYLNSPKTQN